MNVRFSSHYCFNHDCVMLCLSGFLTADLINRIQILLKRLFKFGYSSHLISFPDLIKSCSEDLFENAQKSNHCLFTNCFLPMFIG